MEEDRRKRERAEMVKYNNIGKYLHEYDLVNLYDLEGISRPDEREKLK